jgi:hypothetical protein
MTNEIVLLIVVAAACLIVGAAIFAAFAIKKGWNIAGTLATAESGVNMAGVIAETLQPFLPSGPYTIIDKIIEYAKTAVKGAEQLNLITQKSGAAKKNEATDFVKNALTMAGVPITQEVLNLIDKSIEAAVYAITKLPTDQLKIPTATTPATDASANIISTSAPAVTQ